MSDSPVLDAGAADRRHNRSPATAWDVTPLSGRWCNRATPAFHIRELALPYSCCSTRQSLGPPGLLDRRSDRTAPAIRSCSRLAPPHPAATALSAVADRAPHMRP